MYKVIFSFFIFLFLVALILIALGYYSDTDVLKIVAYGFIFMLGFMLISDTPFGSVEDCEYVTYQVVTINETATYTNQYLCDNIESRAFGFWIAVLGVLGFATVYLQRKGGAIEQ